MVKLFVITDQMTFSGSKIRNNMGARGLVPSQGSDGKAPESAQRGKEASDRQRSEKAGEKSRVGQLGREHHGEGKVVEGVHDLYSRALRRSGEARFGSMVWIVIGTNERI